MKRTCARCKKELAAQVFRPDRDNRITGGICGDCLQQIFMDRPRRGREILDSIGAPVLLLDKGYRIMAANKPARKILARPLADIENFLPGEAMECINARLPGGCGQTVHCQACALRNTLNKTIMTGVDLEKVPAYQDVYQKDGSVARRLLLISTEKLEDFILLRIDEVETLRTMQAARRDPPVTTA
jgi:PAS domain-containing protein